ncbi:hypothetical protein AB5J52_46215 [Streptomyces sp. R39]|uniref:Uncharacterized protein n=1 Tax=Streptomyces sp. R39 TaxID=3238631 RepID=A0AB39QZL0_9ACTN
MSGAVEGRGERHLAPGPVLVGGVRGVLVVAEDLPRPLERR